MRYRELPVLSEDERTVNAALAAGLDRDSARVLAYLLARRDSATVETDTAGRLEIQFGTGLGRDSTITATNTLTAAGLVTTTPIETPTHGRPRKGWRATQNAESTIEQVLDRHAVQLLETGTALGARYGSAPDVDLETGDTPSGARVHIGLNWEPNAVHFPLLVADALGLYERAGIEVEWTPNRGSGPAVESVLADTADLGVAGPGTVMKGLLAGDPLIPLALLYQRSMVVLYTLREQFGGPFSSVTQLRDRRVAMVPDSETGLIARVFLSQAGVADSIEAIEVAGEERAALLDETADVAAGVFTDPLLLEREGHEVDSVLVAKDFPIPGPVLFTHRDFLVEQTDVLTRFLHGTARGWARGVSEPARVSKILAETAVGPVDESVVEQLVETFGPTPSRTDRRWGVQTEDTWDRVAETLRPLEESR